MASPFTRLEEELTCSVCCDVFKDPVVLACSHSFCRGCLQEWWTERPVQECPVCKKRTKKSSGKHPPPTNLVLKNLCEKYLEEKRRSQSAASSAVSSAAAAAVELDLCAAHGEKLRLFCRDDQQLACLVCRDSDRHAGHAFSPVDEASGRIKETVRASLKPLREKLEVFDGAKAKCERTGDHILLQAQSTETRIKAQFEAFRRFLKDEERARISALRREEAAKSGTVAQRVAELDRETASLQDLIGAVEDQLSSVDHVWFLQNYRTTMERVQLSLQPYVEPQVVSGPLMDEAKHLGNLAFSVWDKMKEMVSYTPVTLDPNTAYPEFILSHDLTGVTLDVLKTQQLPDNPERFDWSDMVLGSEGFSSGVHSWDVEVGDNASWSLGVLAESYRRKGDAGGESWLTKRGSTGFHAVHSSRSTGGGDDDDDDETVLAPMRKPRRVRVGLDWSGGTLSFSDPDAKAHLHTFRHAFSERLFPCVSILSHNMSLKMLPAKVCVTLENT